MGDLRKTLAERWPLVIAVAVALFILGSLAGGSGHALADEDGEGEGEGCLGCHSYGLTTTDNGQEISLQIDAAKLEASPHGDVSCTSCHTENHGPLAEIKQAAYAACANCHTGYDFTAASAAGGAATAGAAAPGATGVASAPGASAGAAGLFIHPNPPLECATCHGPIHAVVPASDPASPLNPAGNVQFCGSCHDKQAQAYDYSYHGTAHKLGSTEAPVCATCHGHLPPVNAGPTAATIGAGTSMPSSESSCSNCHVGGAAALANLVATGPEHVTPKDPGSGFSGLAQWVVWKFFLLLILVNVTKDGVVAILDLVRRFRRAGRAPGAGVAVGGGR